MKSSNVIRQRAAVSRPRRETLNGHMSINLWFTGLSGSGKSTLAHAVEERLHLMGCRTYVFDGDNVRRIAEMINLFLDAGVISLTAFISPLKTDREHVQEIIGADNLIEVYCNCPLEICEARDVKGLYKKARAGEIKNYTGISSPYEIPESPDIELNTGTRPLRECVNVIIDELRERGVILR